MSGNRSERPQARLGRVQRLDAILAQLNSAGAVGVVDLAEQFGVSAASVRRDLEALERQHLLVRTHGGALAHGVTYELPMRYRTGRQEQQKRDIAAEAARRVPSSRTTVGLTGGTTTTEVARCLLGREALTVVTNAINIASELVVRPNIKLVVTGGVARSESYELCGPLAEATLVGLNLDLAFVGVDGVSSTVGICTHHEVEAHTNATMISRAHRVIVVADSTKLERVAFSRICPLEQVDELITDQGADPETVAAIERAGLQVTIAPPAH